MFPQLVRGPPLCERERALPNPPLGPRAVWHNLQVLKKLNLRHAGFLTLFSVAVWEHWWWNIFSKAKCLLWFHLTGESELLRLDHHCSSSHSHTSTICIQVQALRLLAATCVFINKVAYWIPIVLGDVMLFTHAQLITIHNINSNCDPCKLRGFSDCVRDSLFIDDCFLSVFARGAIS